MHLLDARVALEAALLLDGRGAPRRDRPMAGCDSGVAPGEERAERRRQERQPETETKEHERTAQPRAALRTEPFENFAFAPNRWAIVGVMSIVRWSSLTILPRLKSGPHTAP